MKKLLSFLLAAAALTPSANADVTMNVYDHVTYYDGYRLRDFPEDMPDDDCLRIYTCLNTKKLSDELLDNLGEHLTLNVYVHALCDNYDRIGSVNLALVPKGAESYDVEWKETDPQRIEVARFITPFMDMNVEPSTCPYTWKVDYLSNILRDKNLRDKYDFWLELMIFGVPYAANSQIAGCSGRSDVFEGSLDLVTDDTPAPAVESNVLVPITIRTGDWRADRGINNYIEGCTDEIGKTIKTYTFDVPEDCADGRVILIMSNHGAGTNGEEYSRRTHHIYYDDVESLVFKPGRETCEPFREYNTQANGIYGFTPKSNRSWQSFSNWCPGDIIDNRPIELGAVKAGTHSIRIEVPYAKFYGNDGAFPVSLYFQGDTKNTLPSSDVAPTIADDYKTGIFIEGNRLRVDAPSEIAEVSIFSVSGQLLQSVAPAPGRTSLSLSTVGIQSGIYVVAVDLGTTREAHKVKL